MKAELIEKYCRGCRKHKIELGMDYCMRIEVEWLKLDIEGRKSVSPTSYIVKRNFIVPETCVFSLELMMEGAKCAQS